MLPFPATPRVTDRRVPLVYPFPSPMGALRAPEH